MIGELEASLKPSIFSYLKDKMKLNFAVGIQFMLKNI